MPGESPADGPEDLVVFDTADRRLTRAGTTLERSGAGSGAGWTLLLPVSPVRGKTPDPSPAADGRIRFFEPLGSNPNALPPAFLALTRARALGQPLAPMPADHDPADDFADEPPDPRRADPGEIAVAHLRAQAARLVAYDPQVRLNLDDSIHQIRVAIRKLRSDLTTFRPLFARERTEPLRAELSWLSGVLGAARDAEVIRDRLEAELGQQPAEMIIGPVRRRIDRELGQEYRQAHIAVIQALNSVRYLELLRNLEKFIADPPLAPRKPGGSPASVAMPAGPILPIGRYPGRSAEAGWEQLREQELTALVAKAHDRLLKAHRIAAAARTPDEREFLLHEVRKAAKRSRYAADAVRPALGKPARRYAKAAAGVQEVLGNNQDAVVLRARLLTLAARATAAAESAFTYGRVHAQLEQRADLDEAELQTAWDVLLGVAAVWPG